MRFERPRRAHFRLASGVIVRDLFKPAKLQGCYVDPQTPQPSSVTNNVIAFNNVRNILTGTAAETILGTINIPGSSLGPNGLIRLTTIWNISNNANAKNIRVRLGGIGGPDFAAAINVANLGAAVLQTYIFNSSVGGQLGGSICFLTPTANSSSFIASSAVDTKALIQLVITGQLANGGDNLFLEAYLAEIFRF
jgi:hypothetical protein